MLRIYVFFLRSNCRTKSGDYGIMTRYEGLVCINDSRLADPHNIGRRDRACKNTLPDEQGE